MIISRKVYHILFMYSSCLYIYLIDISWISIGIWARISKYIHGKQSGVITHPFSNFNGSLDKPLIARSMGPTWDPSGADRTRVGPKYAPWTLLSGPLIKLGHGLLIDSYKTMYVVTHSSMHFFKLFINVAVKYSVMIWIVIIYILIWTHWKTTFTWCFRKNIQLWMIL